VERNRERNSLRLAEARDEFVLRRDRASTGGHVVRPVRYSCTTKSHRQIRQVRCAYPRQSEGIFSPALVCVCVCLSETTIINKIVDGFVPNFTGRFLVGKGRPSSCFVMIGSGM